MTKGMEFEFLAHKATELYGGSWRDDLLKFVLRDRTFFLDAIRQHEDPRTQRALRLLDAVENPTEELLASIGDYCIENGAEGCALGRRSEELGAYAITALRENVQ